MGSPINNSKNCLKAKETIMRYKIQAYTQNFQSLLVTENKKIKQTWYSIKWKQIISNFDHGNVSAHPCGTIVELVSISCPISMYNSDTEFTHVLTHVIHSGLH